MSLPIRSLLPFSTGVFILPDQEFWMTARPQLDFWFRRLVIKHAERWKMLKLTVEDRTLINRSIPGNQFSFDQVTSPIVMDRAFRAAGDICLHMQYCGPGSVVGAPFEACIFGSSQEDPLKVRAPDPTPETVTVHASCAVSTPTTTLELKIQDVPKGFFPEVLTLDDAENWTVDDIRIDGKSFLLQPGDLPGEMFSGHPNAPRLRFGHLGSDSRVEVTATFRGTTLPPRFGFSLTGPRSAKDRSDHAQDRLLPWSSTGHVVPYNTSTLITARVQDILPTDHGFQPCRVVVSDPEAWVFNDIKIGNQSQFVQSGDVPGIAFHPEAPPGLIRMRPAAPALDVEVSVTQIKHHLRDVSFVCGIAGNLVPLSPECQP